MGEIAYTDNCEMVSANAIFPDYVAGVVTTTHESVRLGILPLLKILINEFPVLCLGHEIDSVIA